MAAYLNYLMLEKVFLMIASLATFAPVWGWIMILLSQIPFGRKIGKKAASKLQFAVLGGI